MESMKKMVIMICAAVICAIMFTITAAASTVVVDFSKDDFVMGGISNAESDYINDDGKRVLFVHVTDGFDPDEDDPGSIKGDPNGGIEDFESYGVDGDVHKYMAASIKNESGAPFFEIHFSSPSSGYAVATSVNFGIEPNSGYTKYVWNIEEWYERYYPKRDADHPQGGTSDPFFNHWSGIINQLRLDFMYYTEPGGQARTGDKIYLEYIAFFETEAAANDFTFTPARTPDSMEADRAATEAEEIRIAEKREAERIKAQEIREREAAEANESVWDEWDWDAFEFEDEFEDYEDEPKAPAPPATSEAEQELLFYVEDRADLLSAEEWQALETRAEEISEKYLCDVRIFTVNDMRRDYSFYDIEEFAYRIYVGYGTGRDCVLITLSMAGGPGNRDFDFRVWGDWANTAFTLSEIDDILDNHILPQLRNENYYQAFTAFFNRAVYSFEMAELGSPFSEDNEPQEELEPTTVEIEAETEQITEEEKVMINEKSNTSLWIILTIVIGLGIILIIILFTVNYYNKCKNNQSVSAAKKIKTIALSASSCAVTAIAALIITMTLISGETSETRLSGRYISQFDNSGYMEFTDKSSVVIYDPLMGTTRGTYILDGNDLEITYTISFMGYRERDTMNFTVSDDRNEISDWLTSYVKKGSKQR